MRSLKEGFSLRQFLKPIKNTNNHPWTFKELWKTEWSYDFEELQRHRMVQGAFRYGLLNDPNKPDWDRVSSMRERLNLYDKGRNMEHLVDIANLCQLEFEEGKHPKRHFSSVDDGIHTKVKGETNEEKQEIRDDWKES